MPSLYLKNNYTSVTPKGIQSRQSSIERGVTSMSKDVNNSNGKIAQVTTSNASFLLTHQLHINTNLQEKPPSSSSKRITKPAIIKTTLMKAPVDTGARDGPNRTVPVSINTSTNTSVDKLKKTFFKSNC